MTCYTRHLDDILKELKMENTCENRKELDRKIRFALNRENDDCPIVWKHVKEQLRDPANRERFIEKLKKYCYIYINSFSAAASLRRKRVTQRIKYIN